MTSSHRPVFAAAPTARRAAGALLLLLSLLSPPGAGAQPGEAARGALEPVTLSARDLDIQDLLRMLSKSRDINILAGPDVSGTVTVEFFEVPFEEALHAVVAMAGYQVTRRENLYIVRKPTGDDPRDSITRQVRTFRLNYAKAEDVTTVVEAMLSGQGTVVSYAPLRSVVVEDQPDVLARVAQTIDSLDRKPRQVVIEAQILEARLTDDLRFGIDWSLLFSGSEGSGDLTVEGFATPSGGPVEGMFVTWGSGDFSSALEAAAGVSELQSLASPKLLVVDGASAEIIIGGQLGFPVVRTVENTIIQSVEFLDTGTQLVVTPTIADDGYVLMRVHPELSDGVVQEGLPSKSTTQVSSDVLIKDGHTLLIGGLIREREETTRTGIPVLMHIPVLGALFGRTVKTSQRSELIALITPRIVDPGEEVAYNETGMIRLSREGVGR